jgi:DNA-binding response OmpR family regulator
LAQASNQEKKGAATQSRECGVARILLVEDDPDLSRQLVLALRDAGHHVDHVQDGEEGQSRGDTELYDGIILDLDLPKIDGVSVLEHWRRANNNTPVLILTARGAWSEKVAGFDAGAQDYVTKPFHTEELLARIRAMLRSAGNPLTNEFLAMNGGQRAKLMSSRILSIAAGMRALRINAIADEIEQLETIAQSLDAAAIDIPKLRRQTLQILPIFANVLETVGSERGAQMVVAGAVAGLVSLGGWPAVTAYTLSMAAWHGKEAFIEAVRATAAQTRRRNTKSKRKSLHEG